jgi:uncharacterized protein (TIGR02246 family)
MPRDLIVGLFLIATATISMMSFASDESSSAAVRLAIEESHRTYAAAMKRGDAKALASHFTADAILLPQNSGMQRGRDAIQAWFASWLPATMVHTFEATSTEVTVVGDTAYEVGTYKMEFTPQGSPRISNLGKYLMVWKRTSDGTWRILRDMYNTNEAPPANK